MFCEICGGPIRGKPFRVNVEGSTLLVCRACVRYGRKVEISAETSPISAAKPLKSALKPKRTPRKKPARASLSIESEYSVVENYGAIIKKAREKRGLKQEDLAKVLKEKVSLLRKIEAEKQAPPPPLARKIERILSVKILVKPRLDIEDAEFKPPQKFNLTIGDIVRVKTRKK